MFGRFFGRIEDGNKGRLAVETYVRRRRMRITVV
jgi:hypothetical protein